MKKVAVLLLCCLFMFCGCGESMVQAETSAHLTETTKKNETEIEDPFLGLTQKEYECIEDYLSKSYLKISMNELSRIDRIPNENIPTMNGEINYSNNHYGLVFKDGRATIMICIPKSEFEE